MSQGSDPASKSNKPSNNPTRADQSHANSKTPPVPAPVSKPGTSAKDLSKKEAEPPAFEKRIIDRLVKEFGSKVRVLYIRPLRMKIAVDPADIVEIATHIRNALGFDHAESVAGTDYPGAAGPARSVRDLRRAERHGQAMPVASKRIRGHGWSDPWPLSCLWRPERCQFN